ncbi:tetraacyldisaccharide 4'-kinase [Jiulongibacter sp. NS-SX5]|uniref:tetraacyldisaccharide 4'-kinase n=1 Tax=Jiulongibacter sp. NS-SX5 TaxID=3463854 RepID=UPI004059D87C
MLFFLKPLLWPLSILYGVATVVRNWMFDTGIFSSTSTHVYSIGVGNLSVGGSGKTPMISYLIQQFSGYKIAVISRGYGRKTKGLIHVKENHGVQEVGDEVLMLFNKHQDEATFIISEKRVRAVSYIKRNIHDIDLILFDDVFQHRAVKPDHLILLSPYKRPFHRDFLMPIGSLRELRVGYKRASSIIFTKTPRGAFESFNDLKTSIPIYYSSVNPLTPVNCKGQVLKANTAVNVISAIADNSGFVYQVEKEYKIMESKSLLDHSNIVLKDLDFKRTDLPIVCTEKDWVKIKELVSGEEQQKFYIQKIEISVPHEFISKLKSDYKTGMERKHSPING